MSDGRRRRVREVEFRVWGEEPDPLPEPACGSIWNGDWDHAAGVRPTCFRAERHQGEHQDTQKIRGADGFEFYWTEDPKEARREVRDPGDPTSGASEKAE